MLDGVTIRKRKQTREGKRGGEMEFSGGGPGKDTHLDTQLKEGPGRRDKAVWTAWSRAGRPGAEEPQGTTCLSGIINGQKVRGGWRGLAIQACQAS